MKKKMRVHVKGPVPQKTHPQKTHPAKGSVPQIPICGPRKPRPNTVPRQFFTGQARDPDPCLPILVVIYVDVSSSVDIQVLLLRSPKSERNKTKEIKC